MSGSTRIRSCRYSAKATRRHNAAANERDPGAIACRGHVPVLYRFLFLIVITDIQAVDSRDPSCPFLRSWWRVLQLLLCPLLGSGYYHLLSGLWLVLALGRCGLTSSRSRCRRRAAGARWALVPFVRLIGCVRAFTCRRAREAVRRDERGTSTHGDGSSALRARQRPRLTCTTCPVLTSSRKCR
jgi:hypothetical protein